LSATRSNLLKAAQLPIQPQALTQAAQPQPPRFTPYPAQVFAFDAGRWMHQPMRQLAVGGKNQQSRSVEIESSNCNPAATPESGQVIKHGRSA
jgi:hypothetical protein